MAVETSLGQPVRTSVDMSVDLAGAHLPSPMMTASGCAANGRELARFLDVRELGAFVTKSVMADPRSGRGVIDDLPLSRGHAHRRARR